MAENAFTNLTLSMLPPFKGWYWDNGLPGISLLVFIRRPTQRRNKVYQACTKSYPSSEIISACAIPGRLYTTAIHTEYHNSVCPYSILVCKCTLHRRKRADVPLSNFEWVFSSSGGDSRGGPLPWRIGMWLIPHRSWWTPTVDEPLV